MKRRYITERAVASVAAVGILLATLGVMMTEGGQAAGWWLAGTGAVLQLSAMITVKGMWKTWEKR